MMNILTYEFLDKALAENNNEILVMARETAYSFAGYLDFQKGQKYFLCYDVATDMYCIMLPNSARSVVKKYRKSDTSSEGALMRQFFGYVYEEVYCLIEFNEQIESYSNAIKQFVAGNKNADLFISDDLHWVIRLMSVDIDELARKAPARTDETLFSATRTGIHLEIDIDPAEYEFYRQ
ncbi:hypothetical protein [Lysinibacillus sp. UGB7]|uniref:hypothetical protein n=1 Tax=Lysinibacillus sp. UGB7 TaxID=3411039 RepID=UPI003B9DCD56